jgi:hypothetical protein
MDAQVQEVPWVHTAASGSARRVVGILRNRHYKKYFYQRPEELQEIGILRNNYVIGL